MSLDFLKRLAIGLGALVVLWIGAEILRDNPGDGLTEFQLLPSEGGEPDSIIVTRQIDQIVLRRVGENVWSVNGYRAAVPSVTEFIDALKEGARAELVARNPSSFSRFDIGDQTARRIQAYVGNDVVVNLLVGKRGSDFQSAYLRWPGEDDVFIARSSIGPMVDRPINDWRDKNIVNIAADMIAGLDVSRGGATYRIAKADSGQWNIDGQPADSGAVARLMAQFALLNGTGFPTNVQMDSVDLDQPDRRVTLRDAGNAVLAELAFDSTAVSGFWVQRAGDSTVLRLDSFRVDQLTPADSTLRRGT